MRMLAFTAVVFIVSGCSALAGKTPEELRTVSEQSLVLDCAQNQELGKPRPEVIAEMKRRGMLTPEEWDAIDRGVVFVGMTERAAWVSWGQPRRVNVSTGRWGTVRQLVFSGVNDPPWAYVSVGPDGKVEHIDKFD